MIAIVEDDRDWESYYRGLLKDYELEFFHDGLAAIYRMDERRPDLVILDILLTGPTGFAVLNEMQSYPELAEIPVVVVSSVSLDEVDLKKYGVRAVLDKGKMTPKELLAIVEKELGDIDARP